MRAYYKANSVLTHTSSQSMFSMRIGTNSENYINILI